MRRPLAAEFSVEEQSLARRWALTSVTLYSTLIIVGMLLATSGAEKVTVTSTPEPTELLQERLPMRPYGSLPNAGRSVIACAAPQLCARLTPDNVAGAK